MIRTSASASGEGNLKSGDPGASGTGGQGGSVDGLPCATQMYENYHVHFFVGIYLNGQQVAVPDGIGMVNPGSEMTFNGVPNQVVYATCYYYIHTHDASGEVHLEAASPTCGAAANYTTPCNMSLYSFGNFLDVWGISLSANNFGPFNGPVSIYTTPSGYRTCGNPCYTYSSTYSLYTGDPRSIPLYSHTTIWIVIGSGNPTGSSLPNIQWVYGDP